VVHTALRVKSNKNITEGELLTSYENPVILSYRQHKNLLKGGLLMQVPTPIVCRAANCG
jgi:hypothetical protein